MTDTFSSSPLDQAQRLAKEVSRLQFLSGRERQVLDAWLRGHSQVEIAFDLSLSPKTVNTYKVSIQNKLHCTTDIELFKFAARNALTDIWSEHNSLQQ